MERVIERCAGLDVHKKTVTVCVRVPGTGGDRAQHVRTFGTTTAELLTLWDWLEAHGVTHVAMESTGVYWRPVFYAPFAEDLARLDTIHGVNQRTAEVLIAELGVDMTVFPPPSISRAGPASVPATMRAPANIALAAPAGATAGSARPSSKRLSQRAPARPPAPSPLATAASSAIAVTRRRWSPWRTPCWSPRTTSCSAARPTRIPRGLLRLPSRRAGPVAALFRRWNARAIASSSNPQRGTRGEFAA